MRKLARLAREGRVADLHAHAGEVIDTPSGRIRLDAVTSDGEVFVTALNRVGVFDYERNRVDDGVRAMSLETFAQEVDAQSARPSAPKGGPA